MDLLDKKNKKKIMTNREAIISIIKMVESY